MAKKQPVKTEFVWDDILEVEESLSAYDIFTNGFTGRKANPDSYGTIVGPKQLDKWIDANTFSSEHLLYCIKYWLNNPNVHPPLRLVALLVKRKKFPKLIIDKES